MQKELEMKLAELNARIEDLKSQDRPEDWDFDPTDRAWRTGFREALNEQKEWIEGLIANFCE